MISATVLDDFLVALSCLLVHSGKEEVYYALNTADYGILSPIHSTMASSNSLRVINADTWHLISRSSTSHICSKEFMFELSGGLPII